MKNIQFSKSAIGVIFPESGDKFVNKDGETYYHFPFYLKTRDGETFRVLDKDEIPIEALNFFSKQTSQ